MVRPARRFGIKFRLSRHHKLLSVVPSSQLFPRAHERVVDLRSERFTDSVLGRLIATPHVPLPLVPLPLPVKYHLCYGAPIAPPEGDADDPQLVRRLAEATKAAPKGQR